MDSAPDRSFRVETIAGSANAMIIKYMPDRTWVAENVTMKFFTERYIRELGLLIEGEQHEWCL
jgi:hypothetical protein